MEEERKEKIHDCVGIIRDVSHKDTGKAHFCGEEKEEEERKGRGRKERKGKKDTPSP